MEVKLRARCPIDLRFCTSMYKSGLATFWCLQVLNLAAIFRKLRITTYCRTAVDWTYWNNRRKELRCKKCKQNQVQKRWNVSIGTYVWKNNFEKIICDKSCVKFSTQKQLDKCGHFKLHNDQDLSLLWWSLTANK